MLYAKERDCSAPGCDVTGYYSEVHHPLAENGWTTRKTAHDDTEWIPPPHLDRVQPRINTFHHAEKLLHDADDEAS